jgi:hypothetical protein
MPLRKIDSADVSYYPLLLDLLLLDRYGAERPEQGALLSAAIANAAADGVTDVFIASHGWKGDVPAAIEQYDKWIAKMAEQGTGPRLGPALGPLLQIVGH